MSEKQFTYHDFIDLLHVDEKYTKGDNRQNYFGFRLDVDGIRMLPPTHDIHQWTHDKNYEIRKTHQLSPPGNRKPLWLRDKETRLVARPAKRWTFVRDADGNVKTTPCERKFFEDFPLHTLEKEPVLKFPCTPDELLNFLANSGLDGMVDPDGLAGIIQKKGAETDQDAQSVASVALGETEQKKACTATAAQPAYLEDKHYRGRKEIIDAFKLHGRAVKWTQVCNYRKDQGLAIVYEGRTPTLKRFELLRFLEQ